MSGKFLLDTNIVIGLFQNEEVIIERLKQINNIFVPSIVIGELVSVHVVAHPHDLIFA